MIDASLPAMPNGPEQDPNKGRNPELVSASQANSEADKTTGSEVSVSGSRMKTPQIMRDCLQRRLDEGSSKLDAPQDAYLLAKECKRLGWPLTAALGTIQQFADKCSPPIMGSALNGMLKAVRTVYERDDAPLSCKRDRTLCRRGFCFLTGETDTACEFNNTLKLILEFQRTRKFREDGWAGWEKWLLNRYRSMGQHAVVFYLTLRLVECERGIPAGETIFVGYRDIATLIRIQYRDFKPGTHVLANACRILEDVGLIEVDHAPPNQGPATHRKANGYRRVLPIPPVRIDSDGPLIYPPKL